MKTNETKMKKMMVKGVCSLALAGTVFGTVAPMVENNVAMAVETAPEDGIVLWDTSGGGAPIVKDWDENGRTLTGRLFLGNAKIRVMYDIPAQDIFSQDVQNLVTAPDGSFSYTVSKDVPEGKVDVMVFGANGQQISGSSYWLKKGLINNNGGTVTPEPEKPTEPDNGGYPDTGGDVTPKPEKPSVPDNGGDVTPEPEKPSVPDNGGAVTPEPEKPSVPDNGGDVTPKPEKPSVPDNGGEVTPEPEKPVEKPAEKPVANNKSATNQQPTYNTGDTLAKTATTNNSVILAAIGGIASLVMGLETLISRKK